MLVKMFSFVAVVTVNTKLLLNVQKEDNAFKNLGSYFYMFLWLEESLFGPPLVPAGLHILWTVCGWQW